MLVTIGKFEYDVPAGYTALVHERTKRIMAYTTVNKSTDLF